MDFIIDEPKVEIDGEGNKLVSLVTFPNGMTKKLWYYAKSSDILFKPELSDAFLVALIPYAMIISGKNLDEVVKINCLGKVSSSLLFQLERYLIPTLTKNIQYYESINILAEPAEISYSPDWVGTGISGGVDSSYSIASNLENEDGLRLTHGFNFNVGIYGGYDSEAQKGLERKCMQIAKEANIEYISMTSNICLELYKAAHAPIVPFIFMSMALAIQHKMKVYFFSSAFTVKDFYMSDVDAAYFDILTTQYLSSNNIRFYSSGMEVSRLEKVDYISDYPFTYNNLSVCLNVNKDGTNCNRCAKCTRTMAELDVLGKLDRYSTVFDLQEFRSNPEYHWGYVLLKSKGDSFCKEIVDKYIEKNGSFSLSVKKEALHKWIKRGFTATNKARIKIEDIIG